MKESFQTESLLFTALAFGGNAVARRASGKVCFVPGILPGEQARIRITEEKKNYSCGELVTLQKTSPDRIPFSCPENCPGCPYRMMEYARELEWKNKQLEEFVKRLKKMEVKTLLPATGAICRTFWRNKIALHLSGGKLCYIGRDNVSFVPVENCPAASEAINAFIMAYPPESYMKGAKEGKVTFRSTSSDGVCIYTQEEQEKKILTETLGKYGDFLVELRSFFQINTFMAPVLAEKFLDILQTLPVKSIVELYCGCGVFSVLASERLQIPCCGIELDENSIFLAKKNAVKHKISSENCRFYAGDAGKVMKELYGRKRLPEGTLLLVDPPRTGLAQNTISALLFSEADWVVYISCNPATLMRDLESLSGKYEALQMELLDLFPATAHFETLVLLKHK